MKVLQFKFFDYKAVTILFFVVEVFVKVTVLVLVVEVLRLLITEVLQ